jgi:hypothetical protein
LPKETDWHLVIAKIRVAQESFQHMNVIKLI